MMMMMMIEMMMVMIMIMVMMMMIFKLMMMNSNIKMMIMNFDDQNDDNLDNGGGDFDNLDDIFRIGKDNDRDGSNDKSEDTHKKNG